MPKKELLSVSPDGVYGLNWDSAGYVQVILMETGENIAWLLDNYPRWVKRAVFSRDMRRVLCLNEDGSVCVWRMAPKTDYAWRDKNIVDYLFFLGEESTCRRGDAGGFFRALRLDRINQA